MKKQFQIKSMRMFNLPNEKGVRQNSPKGINENIPMQAIGAAQGKTEHPPLSGSTIVHSIVVIGYKANGDVIYMDPAKSYLQEVNPSHLLDKETQKVNGLDVNGYKIVITGI